MSAGRSADDVERDLLTVQQRLMEIKGMMEAAPAEDYPVYMAELKKVMDACYYATIATTDYTTLVIATILPHVVLSLVLLALRGLITYN